MTAAVLVPFALADQAVDVLAALADPATTCADLDALRAEAGAVADAIVAEADDPRYGAAGHDGTPSTMHAEVGRC